MQYRAELEGYITSHNITLRNVNDIPAPLSAFNLTELEEEVKRHMAWCKSGMHEILVNQSKGNPEMLSYLGDC